MVEPAPILYSFRRCPYAMRARMAVAVAGIETELREVTLRDKPAEMVAASPKATVPVLVLPEGKVIDESLDIMLWALHQDDPKGWCVPNLEAQLALIASCQSDFKDHLDRYKYPNRYLGEDPLHHRAEGLAWLEKVGIETLGDKAFLFGGEPKLADIAVFPFVRQFAHTDREVFSTLAPPPIANWLERCLALSLFTAVMAKHAPWQPGDEPLRFPGE